MHKGKPRFVHGGDVYTGGSPRGQWLDFSANINPLGLADSVKKAIVDNIDGLVHYPDPRGRELKEAVGRWCGVETASVVLGNGAAELFYVYFHMKRPRRVLLPVPSFSEYEKAALCAGAEVQYFFLPEQDGFRLDFHRLAEAMEGCQTVVLGNPNNPTGNLLLRTDLEDFISLAARAGVDVMVDESFLDFRRYKALYSLCDLAEQYPNLLIISSLTKMFAFPGIRVGYGIANPRLVQELEFHKDVWNVNSLAQAAGVAALGDVVYKEKTLQHTEETVAWMYKALSGIPGVRVYPPAVNFVLLNLADTGLNSGQLVAAMRQKGILIRDCANYPGLDERFIRVAVRGQEENALVVQALRECVGV